MPSRISSAGEFAITTIKSSFSKLESGIIKNIESELLDKIIYYLLGDDSESIRIAENIYSSLTRKSSEKEIEEQIWFANFNTVFRKLPIPTALIDYVLTKISELNISKYYLLERINSNESLSADINQDPNYECNIWFCGEESNTQIIKISLDKETFDSILDKSLETIPYIFMFCIVFYLLKIEVLGDQRSISLEENLKLMDETTEILNSFKFYSLIEKHKALAIIENQAQFSDVLNSFDSENIEILSDILSGFKYASELDIKKTNERLRKLKDNMHWDLGFVLKLVGMSFLELDDISTSLKKELLEEIENLILKYKNIPKETRKIETY